MARPAHEGEGRAPQHGEREPQGRARARTAAGGLRLGAGIGRPQAAAKGELDIIAAGPAAALERCRPVFKPLSRQVFVVGTNPEHANAVKIARDFLLATVIESLGEAIALVCGSGVKAGRSS